MLNIDQLTHLHITYTNPDNFNDDVTLNYKLRNTPIANKWVNRVLAALTEEYPIDSPGRFYGFDTVEKESQTAIQAMNSLIDKLENVWDITVDRRLHNVNDQDTLNYLHHIFEIEHGLLDVQNNNLDLQKDLSDLNILVHRCESIQRGNHPRHVVTYFGLAKTETLEPEDYQYFEPSITFGTVYINYVEIGKTLQDLILDRDRYIDPAAFRPFKHYSADFVVRLFDFVLPLEPFKEYYELHQDFFMQLGYSWDDLSKSIGSIPVADLDCQDDVLKLLETRQFVKAIQFS